MSKLKELVDKSRGTTKTQYELEVDAGRAEFQFGDANGNDLFGSDADISAYTPKNGKGWDGRFPTENEVFYKAVSERIIKNKS